MIVGNNRLKVEIREDIYSGRLAIRFMRGDFDYFINTIKSFPLSTFSRKEKIWTIPIELGIAFLNTFNLPQTPAFISYIRTLLYNRKSLERGTQIFNTYYSKLLNTTLKTHLLPFQEDGVKFLLGTKGAILNADIGLGKTLIALTASIILHEKWKDDIRANFSSNMSPEKLRELLTRKKFRVLVVCPSSLKYHWKEQIKEHFSPSISYTVVDGGKQVRTSQYKYPSLFTITSYELVRMDWDINLLRSIPFNIIILDEVTKIKNFRTKTYKNILKIPSTYKWGLTGSAIENSPVDLFSIFNFIDRSKFNKDWWMFKKHFLITHPITLPDGRTYEEVVDYKNLELLKLLTRPYIFIKKKRDVLKQLPPVIQKNYWLHLTPEQEEAYDEILEMVRAQEVDPLASLTYLREVVNSTSLISNLLPNLNGSSCKLEELLSILPETGDEKVVIFSQFKKFVDLVEEELERNNYTTLKITGEDSSEEKMKKVEKFNNHKGKIILLATDVIAYGINLQHSCSILINLDLPWNPMKLENRIGRLDRMGQKNPVTVINLLTKSTIEERVWNILTKKKELINKLLSLEREVKDMEFYRWLVERR